MGNEFSLQTLKVKSKMASARLQQNGSKKENALVKQRREIVKLIIDDKYQKARIKVEGVIREEKLCRVMDYLQMMCELIHQRVKQIQLSKECPEDLTETVCTILYCAKRMDVQELSELGAQFRAKWGQKWFDQNIENRSGRVAREIVTKLDPMPPRFEEIEEKLKELCKKHDVDFDESKLKPGFEVETADPNEYTVEFDRRPFGMEWTATTDNLNLFVSSVKSGTLAAKRKVVVGSMLIAFNGFDIRNIGGENIHRKAKELGLPLRITFRKGDGMEELGGDDAGDVTVSDSIVNECISALRDPCNSMLTDAEKRDLCKKFGANPAEAASAIFLSTYMVSHPPPMAAAPVTMMGMGGPAMPYPQPGYTSGGPAPMYPQPGYGGPPPGSYGVPPPSAAMQRPPATSEEPPPSEPADEPPSDGGLDDLEARFKALRSGM